MCLDSLLCPVLGCHDNDNDMVGAQGTTVEITNKPNGGVILVVSKKAE